MEILLNPNVAYLLSVAGFLMAILAVLVPGTGLVEIFALFFLLLAGYTIFNLPINYWALGLLVLGVIPFLVALRKSGRQRYLVLSLLALTIGSAFLFRGPGWQPAVNPFLALLVSALTTGFLWIVANKSIQAIRARPVQDLNRLLEAIGTTVTEVHEEGTVQLAGELWSARSEQPIPPEKPVRVVEREGFILVVEPVHKPETVKSEHASQ